MIQSPSITPEHAKNWLDYLGLPLVLLLVLCYLGYSAMKWARPKADKILDTVLANSDRTPKLLEEHTAALMAYKATTDVQNVLLTQVAERSERNEARAHEHSQALTELTKAVLALSLSLQDRKST